MQTDPFFLMGIAGMILVLIGFFMVQSHRWSLDSIKYDIINLIGSLLLVFYSIAGRVWPFVILNGIWAIYSLKDVMGDIIARGKKRVASI